MKPAYRSPSHLPFHLGSLTAGDLLVKLMQTVGRQGYSLDAIFGIEQGFVRQHRVELSPGMSGILSVVALCQPPLPLASFPPGLCCFLCTSAPAAVQSLEVGARKGDARDSSKQSGHSLSLWLLAGPARGTWWAGHTASSLAAQCQQTAQLGGSSWGQVWSGSPIRPLWEEQLTALQQSPHNHFVLTLG